MIEEDRKKKIVYSQLWSLCLDVSEVKVDIIGGEKGGDFPVMQRAEWFINPLLQ